LKRHGHIVPALLLLAGCDEPTIISHVGKMPHMRVEELWTMQTARGIPVEIHGSPFAHVSDREIAEAVRPPAGSAQEVTFYATPPGTWKDGHPWRLVLHFNPQGAPNAPQDCRRVSEARTNPPADGSFTVNAVFCNAERWQAHGYLQALEVEDGDLAAFSEMMRQLLQAIFREEKDR
jgi:hypothetical protein